MSKKPRQSGGRKPAVYHMRKLTDIYVLAMLALFPLLIGPYRYYKFNVFKFGSYLLLFAIYIVGLTLIALRSIGNGYAGRLHGSSVLDRIKDIDASRIFIILYLLWGIVSAIVSPYGKDCIIGQSRYEGLLSMLIYGCIFLFISIWGRFTVRIVRGIAISSLILSAIALFQELGSGFLYPPGGTYANYIFLSTIGHIDCYAGVVSIFFPLLFCAYVLLDDHSLRFRFIELVVLFLLLYTFLFSDVDSGKIGILAAFIFVIAFITDTAQHFAKTLQAATASFCAFALYYGVNVDIYNAFSISFVGGGRFIASVALAIIFAAVGILLEKRNVKFRFSPQAVRKVTVIAVILMILAMLIYVFNYSGNKTLLIEASQLLHGQLSDEAGSIRGYIWKSSWNIIKTHPAWGSGPGTFLGEFVPYNEGYQIYAPNTYVDFAHNDFLQIGVCVGIVGLLIYVAFVASLFTRALFGKLSFKKPKADFGRGSGISASEAKAQRPSESGLANRVILISGIAGYLAHSFFSFSIAIVTPLFWVLAGLLIAETEKAE